MRNDTRGTRRLCLASPRKSRPYASIPCPRRRGVFPPLAIPVSEINWNTELRKIVREYDGLPPEPPRAQRPRPRRGSKTEFRMARIQEITAKYDFYERLSVIGVWTRLVLVGALTVSLFWWPYGRDCGFGLGAFLASNAMAVVAGIALSARSWRNRMPWLFTGALLFVALAWTVIAVHTLPRLGYPNSGAANAGWYCAADR